MDNHELEKLFELVTKLYLEEQAKSGLLQPLPYAFAKKGGELLVFSPFSADSKGILSRLEKMYKGIL